MSTAIQQSRLIPSPYYYDPQEGVYMTVRTIDPVIAKELLMGQRKNRSISKSTVKKYKEFMKLGRWVLNGEPLIFGGGKLIDGQHRLTACVESGETFKAVWIELNEECVFDTLNQGKRRNGADVLSVYGHVNATNFFSSLCILARIDKYGELGYQGFGNQGRLPIPNHEVEEYALKYPHLEVSIRKVDNWYRQFRLKKGPMGALHYLLRRSEADRVPMSEESDDLKSDAFMRSLCLGMNLGQGNPILPLRNSLLRQMSNNEKISPHYIIRGGVLAYNGWMTGQKTNVCRVGRIPTIPKIVKVNGGT